MISFSFQFFSTLYCIVLNIIYICPMKIHQRTFLIVLLFFVSSQSVLCLGIPQRLYPAKVIKKSIQALARKVSR